MIYTDKKLFLELYRTLFSKNVVTLNDHHLTHYPLPNYIIFHIPASHPEDVHTRIQSPACHFIRFE